MDNARRRALAVGFSRGLDAAQSALGEIGYAICGRAADGGSALRMIVDLEPELALCDAILPGMDGFAFARRAQQLRLNVRPVILLLRPAGLRLPGEDMLSRFGARVVDAPTTAATLAEALNGLGCPLPPEKAARLEELLDALGVPRHPGRDCLARAIALVWADRRKLRALKGALYPEAAKAANLSVAQAERAIRHVIDVAWRDGAIEQQHRIFGDTIDARRGKPTCGEMIAQLADILRWEG